MQNQPGERYSTKRLINNKKIDKNAIHLLRKNLFFHGEHMTDLKNLVFVPHKLLKNGL